MWCRMRETAGQALISKAGKWSTCRCPSEQGSQPIGSESVSLSDCPHTLLSNPLWNRNSWDRWDILNSTIERKYYLVPDKRKIKFIRGFQYVWRPLRMISGDSDSVGHGTAPLYQQHCVSLPWHNGLCLLCTVWMFSKHTCVCKCRLLHVLTTWSN